MEINKEELSNDVIKIMKYIPDQGMDLNNSVKFIFGDDSSIYTTDRYINLIKKIKPWKGNITPDSKEKLSESFILTFEEDLGWHFISSSLILSESFIKRYSDKVIWAMICQHQKLSESFILDNKDKVSWSKISLGQTHLSESFIKEHIDKLRPQNIYFFNKTVSQDFKSNFLRRYLP